MSFFDTQCFNLAFNTWGNTSAPRLYMSLQRACDENMHNAIQAILYIRDYRHGLGFRRVGRRALVWFFLHYPNEFEKIIHIIPQYGRWDDLIEFFPNVLNLSDEKFLCRNYAIKNIPDAIMQKLVVIQTKIVDFYAQQILRDLHAMYTNQKVSLCAKWAPTEKDSYDRKYNTIDTLCRALNTTKAKYRKFYISPLRSYLKIVERNMCARKWSEIDYNCVTKHAMFIYTQAFDKHDYTRFREWKKQMTVLNAKQSLYVDYHHLLMYIRRNHYLRNHAEKIWHNVSQYCNGLKNCAVCVNTGICNSENDFVSDVAISLALLVSNTTDSMFRNSVISHTHNPKLFRIKGDSVYEQWKQFCSIPFDSTICLKKLYTYVNNVSCKSINRIIVITNTPLNIANLREINAINSHKKIPQLVWWNLICEKVQIRAEYNALLIDGFHYVLLREIIKNENGSIELILKNLLNNYC